MTRAPSRVERDYPTMFRVFQRQRKVCFFFFFFKTFAFAVCDDNFFSHNMSPRLINCHQASPRQRNELKKKEKKTQRGEKKTTRVVKTILVCGAFLRPLFLFSLRFYCYSFLSFLLVSPPVPSKTREKMVAKKKERKKRDLNARSLFCG